MWATQKRRGLAHPDVHRYPAAAMSRVMVGSRSRKRSVQVSGRRARVFMHIGLGVGIVACREYQVSVPARIAAEALRAYIVMLAVGMIQAASCPRMEQGDQPPTLPVRRGGIMVASLTWTELRESPASPADSAVQAISE